MIIIYINVNESLHLEIKMALAYGNYHELSHQIRFLLFEIGIGLPQSSIDYFITLAHRDALKRLQQAALKEQLLDAPIASHHVHDLLDQLQIRLKKALPASQFFQWQNMRNDLDESIANDALAQAYKQCWNTQIHNEALTHSSLWSWMNKSQTAYQTLLFLEQWGCIGDSYLPTFRTKKGFTRREVLQNSPEFQAKISIHWCALSKENAFIPLQPDRFHNQIAEQFPKEYTLWRERLVLHHLDPDNYYPIPVHPWQWRNQIQPVYASLIDKKRLILLPHHQSLMPSMSLDMMFPLDNSRALIHLATSINTPEMHHSNSTTLNNHSPELMNWLNSLLIRTNHYENSLFLMNQLACISLQDHNISEHRNKKLTASFYQNPINLINKNQKLVPLPSLFSNSPITHKPLIIEIINESGLAPVPYFAFYCYKILLGSLHLFLKHGVVLETLEQNMLIIFEESIPRGLILKKLTDIKIDDRFFVTTKEHSELPLSTSLKTITPDELSTSFIKNILQKNIKRWVNALTAEFQLAETLLWNEVHHALNKVLAEIATDIDPQTLSWQKKQLFQDTWQHQCVFTMKLSSNSFKSVYIQEENPLID